MSRKFISAALVIALSSAAIAQNASDDKNEGKQTRENLTEPLLRVSKARVVPSAPEKPTAKLDIQAAGPNDHPLDPAIRFAKDAVQRIQNDIRDYSCTLVKQERIGAELYPQEYMYTEIRNRKLEDGKIVTPFSVYMYFLKPEKIKGREVLYVENENNGNLVAQEAVGIRKLAGKVQLRPDSNLAMNGNRYPITDVGLENLLAKLIEKAERDRKYGECTVTSKEGVKINGRTCTMFEAVHPTPRPHFDFNIARIYIDEEYRLPVRYEAYTWPTRPNGQPELIECYTYLNLKINVALADGNFKPNRFR